ncbi:Endonuclease 8 1 [Planctomycetes bacterium MalM25]|nr:Endonuclease 8 1 [Planctomycetes bacterium MalM25]
MPEGHTLHRLARDHGKLFVGERLAARSPQGRFADEAKRLSGRELLSVEAVGKHLFYRWGPNGRSKSETRLHIHLGLYGKFRLHTKRDAEGAWPEPRGAVRLRVEGDDATFDLNGPNTCELIDEAAYRHHVERLGPDPLRKDADPERAWSKIERSRSSIGGLLMNQEVIAGVGNIYRCEALHLLGIHPDRPGKEVGRNEFDRLWALLVDLMKLGVKHNRIIIADAGQFGKTPGRLTRDERLRIYKKPNCPVCGAAIDQWKIAGRKVYACGVCQD